MSEIFEKQIEKIIDVVKNNDSLKLTFKFIVLDEKDIDIDSVQKTFFLTIFTKISLKKNILFSEGIDIPDEIATGENIAENIILFNEFLKDKINDALGRHDVIILSIRNDEKNNEIKLATCDEDRDHILQFCQSYLYCLSTIESYQSGIRKISIETKDDENLPLNQQEINIKVETERFNFFLTPAHIHNIIMNPNLCHFVVEMKNDIIERLEKEKYLLNSFTNMLNDDDWLLLEVANTECSEGKVLKINGQNLLIIGGSLRGEPPENKTLC